MSSPKTKAQVIAVWSAPGSPGRTTITASIAVEKAKSGARVLVIDADSYAPSIEFQFGIEQAQSGIASTARMAIQEKLTEQQFEKQCVDFYFGKLQIKVLTGLSMPDRWQEVGFDGINAITEFSCQYFDCIIFDIAPPLSADLINQHSLVQRNSMTIAALQSATNIVAVCGARPLDVHRFVWDYQQLRELKLKAKLSVLVNQVESNSRQIEQTINRLTGCQVEAFIDHEPNVAKRAMQEGVPINLASRNSSFRTQIAKYVLTKLD